MAFPEETSGHNEWPTHPFDAEIDIDDDYMVSLLHNLGDIDTECQRPTLNDPEIQGSGHDLGMAALSISSILRSATEAIEVTKNLNISINSLINLLGSSNGTSSMVQRFNTSMASLTSQTASLCTRIEGLCSLCEHFEESVERNMNSIESLQSLLVRVVALERSAMERLGNYANLTGDSDGLGRSLT